MTNSMFVTAKKQNAGSRRAGERRENSKGMKRHVRLASSISSLDIFFDCWKPSDGRWQADYRLELLIVTILIIQIFYLLSDPKKNA